MESEDKKVRVPAGILFGDLKGSTEEAEVDEVSTVEKLREYERVVNETAESLGPDFYKVKTEGDGFMATFASAHAMVECGFAVQQEFRRRGWQVRLGGHYGEVYRNPSGDSVGADVNRAARIQSAADAARGQFLVSGVVQGIVRRRLAHIRFEPHVPVTAKGVPEALEVFDVLPAADVGKKLGDRPKILTAATAIDKRPPGGGRWIAWGASGVVAVAVLGAVANQLATPEVPDIVTPDAKAVIKRVVPKAKAASAGNAEMIAVMEFENQRSNDSTNDWFRKALQTAFNTELSKTPQISVLAPEIIQQTAREVGTDLMTAAQHLGATRFVSGSYAVMGNTMKIDARITGDGLQEAAESVQGDPEEFFSLQKQLTLATMDHLRVRLTAAEEDSLNKPTNTRLDKYKMLLGAEGVTSGGATLPLAEPQAHRLGGTWWALQWVSLSPAYAQEAPTIASDAAVLAVLEQYRRAHEEGNLDELASLYVTFPADQRASLGAYLSGVRNLHVELADVKIHSREHDVAVTYTRRDNFLDGETGEPVALEVRITKFLVPSGDTWKFTSGS